MPRGRGKQGKILKARRQIRVISRKIKDTAPADGTGRASKNGKAGKK